MSDDIIPEPEPIPPVVPGTVHPIFGRLPTLEEVETENIIFANLPNKVEDCKSALNNAIALIGFFPLPSVAEQTVADREVETALALFRDLDNPDAESVALAISVLSLRGLL